MSKNMSDTRENIIALADQLIRTKGFNAFSYADISAPLDIKNAAVHYHFPNKADLGIAVIEQEIAKLNDCIQQWEKLSPDSQLKKLMGTFQQRSKQGTICLVGSLTPDYDTFSPAMQQKVQEMCKRILDWMADCLEKGRAAKKFSFEGDAYDRALMVMSNLMSSLLYSRVLGGNIFGRMSKQLSKDLS
jgi:TetR/AcrR family transcriptional regulator, transcriptional repressor for nem operon